nr:666_t:CDS:2 [Entrophospora candida]
MSTKDLEKLLLLQCVGTFTALYIITSDLYHVIIFYWDVSTGRTISCFEGTYDHVKLTIQVSRFEKYVRNYLDVNVPRLMIIINPIKVMIENLSDDYVEEFIVPFKPRDTSMREGTILKNMQIEI